jgi:thiamine biosynthesis lipoprotein
MDSTRSIRAFGTTATLTVTDPHALDHAATLLAYEIEDMDLAASRFRDDSEVSMLSRAGGSPMSVSPLMLEAVLVARSVAQWTDGAVDPTVGRSIEAFGYDRDFATITRLDGETKRTPTTGHEPVGQCPAAGPAVGWRSIEVDIDKRTVRVPEDVLLDLGASAKALAADRAAASIARRTGSGTLVSIGGDIAVAGPSPDGGWPIGIAHSSSAPADSVDQVVAISTGALASSSTTVRKWQRAGKVVHHIIDPATGENAQECWSLVSVAASSCVEANAASTAAIVWGPSAPKRLAIAGLPARLVSVTGRVETFCGWPESTSSPLIPGQLVIPEQLAS